MHGVARNAQEVSSPPCLRGRGNGSVRGASRRTSHLAAPELELCVRGCCRTVHQLQQLPRLCLVLPHRALQLSLVRVRLPAAVRHFARRRPHAAGVEDASRLPTARLALGVPASPSHGRGARPRATAAAWAASACGGLRPDCDPGTTAGEEENRRSSLPTFGANTSKNSGQC
jgi:hypothetical protein